MVIGIKLHVYGELLPGGGSNGKGRCSAIITVCETQHNSKVNIILEVMLFRPIRLNRINWFSETSHLYHYRVHSNSEGNLQAAKNIVGNIKLLINWTFI